MVQVSGANSQQKCMEIQMKKGVTSLNKTSRKQNSVVKGIIKLETCKYVQKRMADIYKN